MEKTAGRLFWHYTKIFKWPILGGVFSMVAGQICRQYVPYFLALVYEAVSTYHNNAAEIWGIIGLVFLVQAVGQTVSNLGFWFFSWFTPKLQTLVIRDIFDYVNRHSIAFFSEEMAGNISNKVQQLQSSLYDIFYNSLDSCWSFFYCIIGIVILSLVDWRLSLFFALWLACVLPFGFSLGKKMHQLSKETGSRQSYTNGVIVDSIANYSEIKSFANFHFERLNLLAVLRTLRHAATKEAFMRAKLILWQHLIIAVSMFAFMAFTFWLFVQKAFGAADFIFINGLFMTMGGILFNITWMTNRLSSLIGRINAALATLAVEPEIVDAPDARPLRAKKAAVKFQNVSFAYKDKRQIFKDFSVDIKAGEKIGLVGASGAGKTTFIKLLARYFDVNGGKITINGTDIRKITQDSLHKHISTIPQDVCLFNRTLYENIRYGKTTASRKEVTAAAKKASADVFIKQMPQGYESKVGDRGVILSGGERQRIAIARAVLKNAPILIFDEATSALDSENEKHIQASLKRLMKGKTVIAIAHRLSTLREMDRILVMEKGKIIEEGSHDELLKKGGRYAKLFKMQAGGFLA